MLWLFDCQRTFVHDVLTVKSVHDVVTVITYLLTGRYEEAVSAYKKSLQRAPDNIFAHLSLISSYIQMGREKEARAEAAEVLRINPKFSVDDFAKTLRWKNQSVNDRFVADYRKAGLK